ncbi:MAG: DUF896 domain-containing protein [Zhaonellaceae bacterium]|jgi:uncharacterized protein YnzC (UPF0291/DUF896 family)|nr:DUF896 domain-containing protein [Clostridia bacterium]
MITSEMINRINELAKKQKDIGLSEEEKKEQTILRKKYIEYIKGQVRSSLEQIKKSDPAKHSHQKCNCHKH